MTTEEIIALRAEADAATPVRPLERGDPPWCVSDREGFLEFMVHPDDAFRYLTFGFPFGGRLRKCASVGVAPLVNAIQLQVYDADHARGWRNLPGSPPAVAAETPETELVLALEAQFAGPTADEVAA